jgi:hypothetical protein
MTDRVMGKVARVTSDRELIINRGSDDGVENGMYFYIKGEPEEITDPDTDQVLGEVAPIKVVVRADEVAEKFCIARTFRSRRVKVSDAVEGGVLYGSLGAGMNPLRDALQPPRPAKFETQIETLRMDPKKGSPIKAAESVVQRGDVAESVSEDEDINPVTTTLFR